MPAIQYDAITAQFTSPPSMAESAELHKLLAYRVEGAQFAPQTQKFVRDKTTGQMVYNKRYNGWDGYMRLYKRKTHSFPTGLVPRVRQIIPSLQFQPAYPALARQDYDQIKADLKFTPHWYQKEAFDRLTLRTRATAELPTASGKSLLIAMLALSLRDGIGLVIVPSTYLLHQTRQDLQDLTGNKLEVGIYGDDLCELKPLTIATIQSLTSGIQTRPEIVAWLAEVDWVVFDETHYGAAKSYTDVSGMMPKAMVRYGVTATLRREDNAEIVIEGAVGPICYQVLPKTLIQQGYLARPDLEMHYVDFTGLTWSAKKPTYRTIYKACLSTNLDYNCYIADGIEQDIQEGLTPALVLVQELDHGNYLAEVLQQRGIPTEFIFGQDTQDVRDRAVSKLLGNHYPVLVASGIFDVGVNIPELRSLSLAAGGESVPQTLQRAGRGLRIDRKTGKSTVRIRDFYHDEPLYLRKHSKIRRSVYFETYPGMVSEIDLDQPADP